MKKTIASLKSFVLFLRPGLWLSFITAPLQLIVNTLKLSKWTRTKGKVAALNDFYRPKRDYSLRYSLYEHVLLVENLRDQPIDYLEFGVAKGHSFKWWLEKNKHPDSQFFGFDTFEGLPEKWGAFMKGSMSFSVPELHDSRHEFFKGLFQDTLYHFLAKNKIKQNHRKVIHLDADLFSSTLFVLTTVHPHLTKGDLLIFDEFNVPNHEFLAFECYTKSFYVDYEMIGAVNNYLQVAIKLTKK